MERKTAGDFDPQLLGLFHRYIHGAINRREFLDGAAKFAVGGMTAMGLWEMLRPNYALGAASTQRRQANQSRVRVLSVTKGQLVRWQDARTCSHGRPAVISFQSYW